VGQIVDGLDARMAVYLVAVAADQMQRAGEARAVEILHDVAAGLSRLGRDPDNGDGTRLHQAGDGVAHGSHGIFPVACLMPNDMTFNPDGTEAISSPSP